MKKILFCMKQYVAMGGASLFDLLREFVALIVCKRYRDEELMFLGYYKGGKDAE